MVQCAKLHEQLPGLPYKPFTDALGQRIFDTVSAKAWQDWIEHSKKIVNEYRLDLTQKKAHEVLKAAGFEGAEKAAHPDHKKLIQIGTENRSEF